MPTTKSAPFGTPVIAKKVGGLRTDPTQDATDHAQSLLAALSPPIKAPIKILTNRERFSAPSAITPVVTQSPKPCTGPLRRPSTNMMTEATNKALGSVPGSGRSAPLTSEFAKIAALPNFSSEGRLPVSSSHASRAFEHHLGNTGKAVKVYICDRQFGGANTVTITDPTNSIGHYAAFPAFLAGMPVNARNAAVYLSQEGC